MQSISHSRSECKQCGEKLGKQNDWENWVNSSVNNSRAHFFIEKSTTENGLSRNMLDACTSGQFMYVCTSMHDYVMSQTWRAFRGKSEKIVGRNLEVFAVDEFMSWVIPRWKYILMAPGCFWAEQLSGKPSWRACFSLPFFFLHRSFVRFPQRIFRLFKHSSTRSRKKVSQSTFSSRRARCHAEILKLQSTATKEYFIIN